MAERACINCTKISHEGRQQEQLILNEHPHSVLLIQASTLSSTDTSIHTQFY